MADTWECAYAAGLFDGEGCVQLYMRPGVYGNPDGKNNSFRSNLSIASVDPAPIEWLKARWGGSLRFYAGKRVENGHRALYSLQITGNQAERFAQDILPFLVTKRDEMDLWLIARGLTHKRGSRGRPKGGLQAREVWVRRLLVDQVKVLKRREYSHR